MKITISRDGTPRLGFTIKFQLSKSDLIDTVGYLISSQIFVYDKQELIEGGNKLTRKEFLKEIRHLMFWRGLDSIRNWRDNYADKELNSSIEEFSRKRINQWFPEFK